MDTDPAGVRAENLVNIFIVYRIVLQPVGSRLCVCLCLDDVSCVPHMDTVDCVNDRTGYVRARTYVAQYARCTAVRYSPRFI